MNKFLYLIFAAVFFCCSAIAFEQDDLVEMLSDKEIEKPDSNLHYNYQNTIQVPVKLSIITPVKSEKELYEGQILAFRVAGDIIYNHTLILKKGTMCTARVETIVENGMNGIPASVVLGNFKIDGISSSKLTGEYEKYGLDLSLIVFPLKWALTILPPSGTLTNFIKGGHVKFRKREILKIYYHPDWK